MLRQIVSTVYGETLIVCMVWHISFEPRHTNPRSTSTGRTVRVVCKRHVKW